MSERIVPMIHVPDVNATAQWYASIGFEIRNVNRECDEGEIDWALLHLGQSEIMLSAGGLPSSAPRREFDLYTHVDDVDSLRKSLDGKIELVEDLHQTFYGARVYHPRLQWILDYVCRADQQKITKLAAEAQARASLSFAVPTLFCALLWHTSSSFPARRGFSVRIDRFRIN